MGVWQFNNQIKTESFDEHFLNGKNLILRNNNVSVSSLADANCKTHLLYSSVLITIQNIDYALHILRTYFMGS